MQTTFKRRLPTLATAMVLALCSLTPLQALADLQKVTEVEGISEYRLDNGLKVLLFPDPTKETVTVNVTYKVGSKHENYGETGMAHLLEHLVFKGTPKHRDIPAELSSHGARPNGTTWTDRTNYFETFAATEENIDWALSMESDRMVNSFIAKKDLDSEMTVVRNEFERGENSPFRITLQRMMASAFEWHNYGKSTIGARSDLENVSIERLQDFYRKYYQPDNATLIVAGKFAPEDMLKKIEATFGTIPKPNRTIDPLYTVEPAQDGERQVTVRRVGDVQLLGTIYHVPPGAHEDFAAIDVLNEVLSATPNGRLHKALVEAKLASSVFGMNFQWQDPGVAIFMAEMDKTADMDATQKALLDTLESIRSNPITDKEVETAKRTLLKNLTLAFNSSERVALELSEWLGMGDWRLLFLNRDRLEKVSAADVQRVAEYYLTQNNRTLGRFIPAEKPARVEIPLVADVDALVKDYKGREQVAQGEAFDPSQANIDSRTETLTLSSGTKVSLLQKKTRGESVVVRISGQFGDLRSLSGKNAVGDAVGEMLLRGSSKYSREQIKEELDQLQASLRIGGSNGNLFASVETTRANLLPVLDILTDVLRSPSFPEKEFELYKTETKVAIEQNLQDPQSLAFNAFSRHQSPYGKDDPRYVGTFEEQLAELDKLTLKQVKRYHADFYNAKQMQVSIIGDFDKDATVSALDTLTKGWKSKQTYQRIASPYVKLDAQPITFNTPDKENATFVASLSLPVGDMDADAPALTLGNYILGGGFLSSRLATRLRQQDGLSYGAGSFLRLSSEDQRGSLGAYAICAPQNLARVELGFREEIARLLKDGFTADEVEAAKSGLLQGRKVSRSQDKELVGTLVSNLKLERTMAFDADFEAKLAALTADDLNKAFRKYIKVDDFALIKAGDQSKVE
ncbi:M16 family metallopeptidase [Shewanella litorisediminis]|uniref:Insulinase family protein n=1 Tax=Shewanella litorisediminis TaxID=1173586 RepID=A0ABX7G3B7_9GAMM|nr:pitrilysin family protein [Shewanella litorisediminis]MCL2917338.1 insulinase family protein [Shewanella litorisediminis]QRH01806.1 insulinase family protein [Shewanella litorisediminis]